VACNHSLAACAAISACCIAASTASAQSTTDAVSLDRIKAELQKPPSLLTLTQRKPDFVVEIRERERFEHLVSGLWDGEREWRPRQWIAPSPFGSQPLFSVDLLSIASGIKRQLGESRRAHAASGAAEEVRQSIAAYCAAQPDGGAGIRICSDP